MEYNCYQHVDSYIQVTVEADSEGQAEELATPLLESMSDVEFAKQVIANSEVDCVMCFG